MPRTMTTAERNRAIKKALEAKYGRGKVRVKGDRGTAYGWLTAKIDVTPFDTDEHNKLTAEVWDVLRAADLDKEIGSYDSGDYGAGREISIQFNPTTYAQVMRHDDGSMSVRDHWSKEWRLVPAILTGEAEGTV